jgi:hypothetical protein
MNSSVAIGLGLYDETNTSFTIGTQAWDDTMRSLAKSSSNSRQRVHIALVQFGVQASGCAHSSKTFSNIILVFYLRSLPTVDMANRIIPTI